MRVVYDKKTKVVERTIPNNYIIRDDSKGVAEVAEGSLTKPLKYYKIVDDGLVFDEELYISSTKKRLLKDLTTVYVDVYLDIPTHIDNSIGSKEQVEVYKLKYDRAVANDVAFFKAEAGALGITAEKLLTIVKATGDKYKAVYDSMIGILEMIRVSGSKLINAGKFDLGDRAIMYLSGNQDKFNTVTYEDFLDKVTDGKTITQVLTPPKES